MLKTTNLLDDLTRFIKWLWNWIKGSYHSKTGQKVKGRVGKTLGKIKEHITR